MREDTKQRNQYFQSILIFCIIDHPRSPSTQRVSYLAHAVVCELDVSLVIQENVVQLQVSVDDALFMQEVQSDTDFSSIKSVKREMHRMMFLTCPRGPTSGRRSPLVRNTTGDP